MYIRSVSLIFTFRSSHERCSVKICVLKNVTKFTGKKVCQSLFFNKVAGLRPAALLKKETLAQVFSCEFCDIFKNTFFHRRPLVAASTLGRNEKAKQNTQQTTAPLKKEQSFKKLQLY